MEEDALYRQGESFFFADEYVLANRAYEGIVSQYSGSTYLDTVESRRFAIAQYWLKAAEAQPSILGFNWTDSRLPTTNVAGEARRILHRIRLDDPTGRLQRRRDDGGIGSRAFSSWKLSRSCRCLRRSAQVLPRQSTPIRRAPV